jgi:GH18 family chitinase
MKAKLHSLKLSMLLVLIVGIWQTSVAQFKVVGYAPYWKQTAIQYNKLTHINYSFALPQYGGRLKAVENPAYLQSIVANAHANGVKVFIAIGGWSDNGAVLDPIFESIGGDPGSRANFINDALYIVNTYNLDGVDIDWEYPDAGNSANNFTTLMRELSNALKPRGKGLSFAAAADAYNAGGIQSAVFQYVDFVNIMAYDGAGSHHSTYQFAVDALNLFKGKGCPASKCIVGVPFYARPSWRSYADLIASGASANSDWFGSDGYNGIPTIKQKTQMALNQAGGIMIWELSQDAQGANSLLSAINDVVKAGNNNNNNDVGVTNLAGTYRLQNRHSGLFMDVSGNSSNDGANIHQWTGNDCLCQQFTFTHLGNGTYKIIAKNSGKSLDVASFSLNDGANILQWPYHGGTNQQFTAFATGDGFYKLKVKNSGKLVEVAGFSTSAGGNVQQWADGGQASAQWRLVPVNSSPSSVLIQAENFTAMNGIQVEGTSDIDGGSNIGYVDNSDWLAYNSINFPTSGTYKVEYRVASMGGGRISLDLNAGSIQLGAVNVPATGGWQNWTTISHNVNVNAGTYNVGIFAQAGGWNLNWIRITRQASASASVARANTANLLESTFEFYPNPAENSLNVNSEIQLEGGVARVYDAVGSLVLSSNVDAGNVDVSSLNSGIYTIVISVDGNQVSRRFAKK